MRRLLLTLSITFSKLIAHASFSFRAFGKSRINTVGSRRAEKEWRGTNNIPVRWLCGYYIFPVFCHLPDVCLCWAAGTSNSGQSLLCRKSSTVLATGSATAPCLPPTCGHQEGWGESVRRGQMHGVNFCCIFCWHPEIWDWGTSQDKEQDS